jgi:hypothetical protein
MELRMLIRVSMMSELIHCDITHLVLWSYGNQLKVTNTLSGWNVGFFNVKAIDFCGYHGLLQLRDMVLTFGSLVSFAVDHFSDISWSKIQVWDKLLWCWMFVAVRKLIH